MICYLLWCHSTAQIPFEKVFLSSNNPPDADACFKSIPLLNGNIVSVGLNDGFSFSQSNFYLRMSDENGNELWTRTYTPGIEGRQPDVVISNDSNIVIMYQNEFTDSLNHEVYNTTFNKVDLLGNLILSKTYPFTFYTNEVGLVRLFSLPDSNFIFTTSEHLVKLDRNLDTIIVKRYSRGVISSFININHTEIEIVTLQTINSRDSAILINFNLNLDSLRCISFDSLSYHYIYGFGWNPTYAHVDLNGAIYFNSVKYNTFDSVVLIKVDSSLSFSWSKLITSVYVLCSEFDIDSDDIVFTGNISDDNLLFKNYIYWLDLNGDSILFKSFAAYGGAYKKNYPYDIRIQNKKIYLSGYVRTDTSAQKSYLAKLDSTLNFPVSIYYPDLSDQTIKIFPIPASRAVRFSGLKMNWSYRISVYSVNDILLREARWLNEGDHSLDVSELESGVYFIVIQNDTEIRRFKVPIIKM